MVLKLFPHKDIFVVLYLGLQKIGKLGHVHDLMDTTYTSKYECDKMNVYSNVFQSQNVDEMFSIIIRSILYRYDSMLTIL